ncbi:MAG: SDR family NAD(P)-dependent oxidoreductase, partial [Prevotella sp.]|nr:SDR family NAD(P)-dependent oxidoreductase [Prevotella sp.]
MSLKSYIKRGIKYLLVESRKEHVTANVAVLAPNELLAGRTALITGGTSGIGFAIAKAFLRSGANIVITGRSEERLMSACNELKSQNSKGGGIFSRKKAHRKLAGVKSW